MGDRKMNTTRVIHNCHLHLFTIDHVPKRFLPLGLNTIMRPKCVHKPFIWLLKNVNMFSKRDLLHRFANFTETTYKRNQAKVFDIVRSYYPFGTRFVVLPMDMAFMDAGKVPKDLNAQHAELAILRNDYPDNIIPFAAVDPRRKGVDKMLQKLVEKDKFKGVKIYPPLGYRPNDPVLMKKIYPYCLKKNLPVMTHCSRGGVRHKSEPTATTTGYADPDNCVSIMEKFPKLRFCLGHFGGQDDWEKYLSDEWHDNSSPTDKSWLAKIIDIVGSGKYPNLFVDISYTIFSFKENASLLKVLLQNPNFRMQVLFGSDFYMAEQEKFRERRLSIDLRAFLGEDLFWQIAHANPVRYLTGASPSRAKP